MRLEVLNLPKRSPLRFAFSALMCDVREIFFFFVKVVFLAHEGTVMSDGGIDGRSNVLLNGHSLVVVVMLLLAFFPVQNKKKAVREQVTEDSIREPIEAAMAKKVR